MTADLVVLSADVDIENSLAAILNRPRSLGIRTIDFELIRHPGHDPGVYSTAAELLRPYLGSADHALAVLDCAWDGNPHLDGAAVEAHIEGILSSDWSENAVAVAIEPESEVWLWSTSPHVATSLGWDGSTASLRGWLEESGLWAPGDAKPADPKEAFERTCRRTRTPVSGATFRHVLSKVSLTSCTDRSFLRLVEALQRWFGTA